MRLIKTFCWTIDTCLPRCPLNICLTDIEAPSVTHKFVSMDDMPANSVPSHPSDGKEFLTAVHDHFESGAGTAEALAKAHERVAGLGIPLVTSGAGMTVSGLTNSIRDHLSSSRWVLLMCGCVVTR